jgi:hypothetical protein
VGNVLLTLAAGVASAVGGVAWVSLLLLSGGELLKQVQRERFSFVLTLFPVLVALVALSVTALFAFCLKRVRYGPYSPRLFLSCIALCALSCGAVWALRGR